MEKNKIPDIVVSRLPIYLRALSFLEQEGRQVVSSQELGSRLDISSAQIRKDLSHFGEFGKQGTGYKISYLQQQLRRILHIAQTWPVVLVGCGALGGALVHYNGLQARGFEIVAAFDSAPDKVGQPVADKTILDVAQLPDIVRDGQIKVAIIAVPSAGAQQTADVLVKSGIKAILNYAPINISVPPEVQVQYIDPSVHLQHMTYYLRSTGEYTSRHKTST